MRNLAITTAVLLVASVCTFAKAQAATEVQLNSGLYLSGIDQKPVLKITADDSGRSVQIEEPGSQKPVTLSVNENHNFDTTDPLEDGIVSQQFISKCIARAGREKPCDKGMYDMATGQLRIKAGDSYVVTARLLVLSSDTVLRAKWTTFSRDGVTVAQKMKKEVLKWSAPPKTNPGAPSVMSGYDSKSVL